MAQRRTAVVDFDGTIAAYDGWKGPGVYGEPLPGARETLAQLQAAGWEIIIFTARNWEERAALEAYLHRHAIPFHQVVCGKPLGAVYIDDRSTGRGGDWAAVRRDLQLDWPGVSIHPTAVVEPGAEIGEGTKVWHFAHIRSGARIGPGCVLGQGVFIDEGAVLGSACKLQNKVNVYRGVTLEDGVFVGPNATFTNDRFPRAVGEWTVTPTRVGQGASIGAGATVVCGNDIGPWAMVAAGAVVTRSVPAHALVAGVPARRVGWVCSCGCRALRDESGQWRCSVCDSPIDAAAQTST